ncbi:UBX domain protein Ubx2 [Coemansia sp. Cherry 401B]|nr:UBX domain protein Ubx2 [Coemansia sp. Cherry 401B]
MESELVLNFCAVTGAEPDVANGYLQVADSNVEQAISLFFENGGQALQSHGADAAATAAATTETAAGFSEDEVRAPIAARRDVLVDDYGSGIGDIYQHTYGGYPQHMARGSAAASSIFDQHANVGRVPFRDFAQEAAEMSSDPATDPTVARRNRLAELFKPPFDIMHAGDLESARQQALGDGKWVLVNLQDVTDFRCQALNRDIWSQGLIKDIVRKNFVFLQISTEVPEGSRIKTLYNAAGFPFIAVIHPKTGELRTVFARYENVADMLEDMTNYISESSLGKKAGKRRAETDSDDVPSGSTSRGRGPSSIYNLSEEDQLAAAIAASELDGASRRQPVAVGSDDDSGSLSDYSDADSYSDIQSISSDDRYSEDEMDVDSVSAANERMASEHAAISAATSAITVMAGEQPPPPESGPDAWYKSMPASEPLEPAPGPAAVRVQFRFPSGKREVRRFAKTDRVAAIFQYLKATVPEAADEVPEVLFMSTRLSEIVGQTIEEAKLANASLVVDI